MPLDTLTSHDETLSAAVKFYNSGNIKQAKILCKTILKSSPDNFFIARLLAKIYYSEKNPGKAIGYFKKSLAINPVQLECTIELAITLRESGKLQDALAILENSAGRWNGEYIYHYELAVTSEKLAALSNSATHYQKALNHYLSVVKINPAFAIAYNNAGSIFQKYDNQAKAFEMFAKALGAKPDFVLALANIGKLLQAQGNPDAENYYKKALALQPHNIDVLCNLAHLYEQDNRPEQAEEAAWQIIAIEPDNIFANIIWATCNRRKGRIDEALAKLSYIAEKTSKNLIDPQVKLMLYFELAMLHDKTKNYSQAYQTFHKANKTACEVFVEQYAARDKYTDLIDSIKAGLSDNKIEKCDPAEKQPVFLVGFPRSGTTLLNQILDSHPAIQTLEEESIIEIMAQTQSDKNPKQLQNLYYEQVAKIIHLDRNKILIDKLPLNIIHIGFILRVFPNAKFILSVRHPCDACLSCFMQNFNINIPMAHFTSLEDAVNLYAIVMDLWLEYLEIFDVKYHTIRYEDLVADFSAETAKLLGFLGIEEDDRIRDFHKHKRSGKNVISPSYNQVTESIYSTSAYRWLNYKEYFAAHIGKLQKYIDYFGY